MNSLHRPSFLRWVTSTFVDSKLTPLVIIASLFMGVFAILLTPSEEEPQIVVPMIDVMVSMPGASPKEVEERVINPMEKLIWEIPGVEYVYSTAMPGKALTVVRFYVGEEVEKSLVKVYDKLYSHFDWIPPGCSKPLLKPRSIDDVPIVTLTFWGDGYDAVTLRSIVATLDDEIRAIEGVSETFIKGGLRRQVRIILDPSKLSSLNLDPKDVVEAIKGQNQASLVGAYTEGNYEFNLRLTNFFKNLDEVKKVVIKVVDGRPVYLGEIAEIKDGPEEPRSYCFVGAGLAAREKGLELAPGELRPAVTLAVAKRKGRNATLIARKVIDKVESLRGHILPEDVHVVVTRDYGETAKEKSNELLEHLAIATISVAVLMAVLLGVRASLVVLVAIPVTLALTLFVYYFYGYTLNRVTLFALIFCIGILVDDPIVGVENIVRHLRLPENKGRRFKDIIVDAVVEVGSPLILATFTVIFAILPLAFVRGLMGPYMRPMPVGASVAMFLSMVVSFVITPWTAYHILGKGARHEEEKEGWFSRLYRWTMGHLIYNRVWRYSFLFGMAILFVLSCALIATKIVKVKMLPFDNKSEFQVIVDMPEGTPLEETYRAAEALGAVLSQESYVTDYEIYVGTSAPFNFNGLVRHYYMREGSNVCDIQVNLVPKHMRELQSHDIAKAIRPKLEAVAKKYGANIKVTEIPPGPPVLQTLVAEIYGPDYEEQIRLAKKVKEVFESVDGIVDVDWYMTDPQKEMRLVIDREKALLSGVNPMRVREILETAVFGKVVGLFHDEDSKEDVPLIVRVPRQDRSSLEEVLSLKVRSVTGKAVSLRELVGVKESVIDHPIYHKNLQPVVYVTGDVAGAEESPVYAILKANKLLDKIETPSKTRLELLYISQPSSTKEWAMKWDGEWHITYEVFRDMGAAFAVVVIIIFILVVGWFRSYSVPLVILSPIPLSLIGIIPAHAMMNAFFTATSMIGFIAGAGIVVRNSIILVDFIELRLKEGMPLGEAVIDAGTIRFRPMLLTSSAVVVGSFVILFDPIFQGLAISLMAGEVAATLFSRMVVPILYYLDHRVKDKLKNIFK
ncbi:Acriflavin resistance protein [Dissulfuribacter thermophilus]|uniref:Acriflavin resistance protein n=1 Tax=Dissulfuribacter thermophilus TaxID=1156395 RepID=A0A1B9F998_9BACT|nr:efflux RND transporter permease subunit [Dissulfuribacter thermophilus]OCC16425.1 Acriflavin resistance protein [Dissulfuribacter thermophilus]